MSSQLYSDFKITHTDRQYVFFFTFLLLFFIYFIDYLKSTLFKSMPIIFLVLYVIFYVICYFSLNLEFCAFITLYEFLIKQLLFVLSHKPPFYFKLTLRLPLFEIPILLYRFFLRPFRMKMT